MGEEADAITVTQADRIALERAVDISRGQIKDDMYVTKQRLDQTHEFLKNYLCHAPSLAAQSFMGEWQPIETAPREVWLLCWGPDAGCGVAKYPFNIIGDEWPDYTDWMPLPEPPDAP